MVADCKTARKTTANESNKQLMSSLELTLDEFVTKIPLCQTTSSWETIVTTLSSSANGIIAVVDPLNCPLGILESHKVLNAIANNSNDCGLGTSQQTTKLISLLSPIIKLSDQLKLKDLLALLSSQETPNSERNYLIVDRIGKVQGMLNISQLMKNMAQGYGSISPRVAQQSCVPNLKQISDEIKNILFLALEQISLPLSLQNAEGDICYQNPAWEKSSHQHQTFSSTELKQHHQFFNSEELKLRSSCLSPNLNSQKPNISTKCLGAIEDNSSNSLSFASQPHSNILTTEMLDPREYLQYSTKNFSEEIVACSEPMAQNNGKLNWQYTSFPIRVEGQNQNQTTNNQSAPEYWLVLGTQIESKNDLATDKAKGLQTNNNLAKVTEFGDANIQDSSDLNKLRRLQSEFMVHFAHDLKSPLTAIIGLSSLLREEKLGSLNSRQIRYLDLVYRSGRQLMGIVTDLLDITSLSTGKVRLKLEPLELEKFCHQAWQQVVTKLETFRNPYKNKPLAIPKFQFDLASESSVVITDRLRLSQILIHLLENAVKSTPSEENIGIRVEQWGDWLAITVWDRGKGISETCQLSLLEASFEPDTFLASPEKTEGLWLILAQQLAQFLGGDISFTSEINRGSEFTVLLPLNTATMSNQEGLGWGEGLTSAQNNQNRSSLVLVIETSPVRIQHWTETLKKLGYDIVIAHNKDEALYKASHLNPTKIVLNNKLRQFFDEDLFTLLKSDPRTSTIPLILTYNYRSESDDQDPQAEHLLLPKTHQISQEILAPYFPPLTSQNYCLASRLTMLRLCLTKGESSGSRSEIDFLLEAPSINLCHHIIEADSIEQANMLARIWKIDAIIWDSGSNLELVLENLRSLSISPHLAKIPLVTLDEATTAAANQFDNLTIFPFLIALNEQNITELMQVIQRAAATAIEPN